MKTRRGNIIYCTTLFLFTFFIWRLLYSDQYLDYDINYGAIILAFLLSILSTIILTIIWFKARHLIKLNSLITILFLLTSSPLTVGTVIYFYQSLFGRLVS